MEAGVYEGSILARAEVVMGIGGGVLGLVMTPVNLILGLVILALTLGGAPQLVLLTGIGALMAIMGIIGAIVSRSHSGTGGAVMLLSGIIPLLAGSVMMVSINAAGVILPLLALYFWTFILVIGGLVAIRKARSSPALPPTSPGPTL